MKIANPLLPLLSIFILMPQLLTAQFTVGNTQLDTTVLADNLNTPWDLAYSIDSSLWFTERIGIVSRIDLKTSKVRKMLDLQNQVEQKGESGLLGMAILENVAISRIYLVYTYLDSNASFFERLVRYDFDLVQDTLINEQILIDSIPAASNHDGSRLVILNNQVFMTTGDAGSKPSSQNLNTLAGKVLRVNLDGSIPADNPIKDSPIYSWGHRNPQGLCYANNFLYSSEHGPINDDELNIILKGRNYGWPDVPGFCDFPQDSAFCNDSNVVEPLFAWTPTLAVSDLCYYDHSAIPEWKGSLLMTTLKASRIVQIKLNANKDSVNSTADFFTNNFGRLRAISIGPGGDVFIATNTNPQQIIRFFNPNVTSLSELDQEKYQLTLSPNPASDFLNVKIKELPIKGRIELFSIEGKKLLSERISQSEFQLSLTNFDGGIYLIQLSDQNGVQITKKIIIQ